MTKRKKVGIKKDSLVKILNIPDIVKITKNWSGSKMVYRVRYFGY